MDIFSVLISRLKKITTYIPSWPHPRQKYFLESQSPGNPLSSFDQVQYLPNFELVRKLYERVVDVKFLQFEGMQQFLVPDERATLKICI